MWRYFDLNNRAFKAWSKAKKESEREVFFQEGAAADEEEKKEEAAPIEAEEEEKKEEERVEGKREEAREETPLLWQDKIATIAERAELPPSRVPPMRLSPIRQIFMYFGIFLGVFLSMALSQFEKVGYFSMTINGGTLIISAIIALCLIPHVYEKLSLNPAAPPIVQFGLFVQNGVFWHVIVNSIGKMV